MMKRNLAMVSLLAATILASLGVTASAIENPQAVSTAVASDALDATLNDKVETLLRTDVGLAGSQLRVQGHAGVIIVGGTVPDEHSLRRALDLASSVRGVREVRNEMEIAVPK